MAIEGRADLPFNYTGYGKLSKGAPVVQRRALTSACLREPARKVFNAVKRGIRSSGFYHSDSK